LPAVCSKRITADSFRFNSCFQSAGDLGETIRNPDQRAERFAVLEKLQKVNHVLFRHAGITATAAVEASDIISDR
jgi:hypothetical protein